MSDSASKKDVEDVLTSVRRLVSSEMPRNRRPNLPAGPGALVLTDAQRVQRPVSKGVAAKSLEDRIAELEAAVSSRNDDYEPDGSEDQSQHRPDRIVYTRPPSETEQARARGAALRLSQLSLVVPPSGVETTAEPDEAEDDSAAPVSFRHAPTTPKDPEPDTVEIDDAAADDEAPMAEDVAAEPPQRAEIHRFHDPDDMLDRFAARMKDGHPPKPGPGHNGFSERLEPYQPEVTEDPQPPQDQETVEETEPSPNHPATSDTIADAVIDDDFEEALNKAVAGSLSSAALARDEDWQEDGQGTAPEDEAVDQSDPAETPEATSEPQPDGQAQPQPEDEPRPDPVAAPVAALVLDEDALRPIVAKLIREELQGELGERITSNVRKLVRREIMRAMSSREFE